MSLPGSEISYRGKFGKNWCGLTELVTSLCKPTLNNVAKEYVEYNYGNSKVK